MRRKRHHTRIAVSTINQLIIHEYNNTKKNEIIVVKADHKYYMSMSMSMDKNTLHYKDDNDDNDDSILVTSDGTTIPRRSEIKTRSPCRLRW